MLSGSIRNETTKLSSTTRKVSLITRLKDLLAFNKEHQQRDLEREEVEELVKKLSALSGVGARLAQGNGSRYYMTENVKV